MIFLKIDVHRYIIYNLYCNIQKHKNQEVQFDFMVTLKPKLRL